MKYFLQLTYLLALKKSAHFTPSITKHTTQQCIANYVSTVTDLTVDVRAYPKAVHAQCTRHTTVHIDQCLLYMATVI